MHLVIVHGYLLRGTGSNIYTANVAETWKRQGHAVTVVCQDHLADTISFVDELIVGTGKIPSTPPPAGSVRVVVPDIGGLLLVYCKDRYQGFEVKTMRECSLKEIDAHIEWMVKSLKLVLDHGVDRVLTNHTILSPVIASRACRGTAIPYDVMIHGSSIIFSIKPRPELRRYAIEGLQHCQKVIVPSFHSAQLLTETFSGLGLEQKIVNIPCGMNPQVFQLANGIQRNQERFLSSVQKFLQRKSNGRRANTISLPPSTSPTLHQVLIALSETYDPIAVDADLPERWNPIRKGEPVICFFGKFINTKGLAELVMSFPLILEKIPNVRLVVIGFGQFREHMEGMLAAMKSGDLPAFYAYARAGDFLDEVTDDQKKHFFRKLSNDQLHQITITGFLEHDQLREILPLASISVVPSKASEAFGMVSVEAMAAGVMPLCNKHSGLADVLSSVEEMEPELGALMRIEVQPGGVHGVADGAFLVEQLPEKITTALHFLYPNGFDDDTRRKEISRKLRAVAVSKFSWEQVGKQLLED